MTELERVVGADADGRRLDVVLVEWLDEPRSRVQRRVTGGAVLVDGEPAAKGHRLRAGEHVQVLQVAPAAVPAAPEVPIRYLDGDLAVVAKPAGLVVHAGAGWRPEPTLVDALQAAGVAPAGGDDPQRPGIVHRLDRGTSGLLVVARTQQAYRGLVEQFSRRAVERAYWALLQGVPEPARATVDAPISRSIARRTRFVVDPGGRPAVSHYDVVEPLGEASVVDVRLETGRTHQVRVHMASIGHPVVADTTYGASPALARRTGLERPALHARLLALTHPVSGRRVELFEPLPRDLERAVASLRGERGR